MDHEGKLIFRGELDDSSFRQIEQRIEELAKKAESVSAALSNIDFKNLKNLQSLSVGIDENQIRKVKAALEDLKKPIKISIKFDESEFDRSLRSIKQKLGELQKELVLSPSVSARVGVGAGVVAGGGGRGSTPPPPPPPATPAPSRARQTTQAPAPADSVRAIENLAPFLPTLRSFFTPFERMAGVAVAPLRRMLDRSAGQVSGRFGYLPGEQNLPGTLKELSSALQQARTLINTVVQQEAFTPRSARKAQFLLRRMEALKGRGEELLKRYSSLPETDLNLAMSSSLEFLQRIQQAENRLTKIFPVETRTSRGLSANELKLLSISSLSDVSTDIKRRLASLATGVRPITDFTVTQFQKYLGQLSTAEEDYKKLLDPILSNTRRHPVLGKLLEASNPEDVEKILASYIPLANTVRAAHYQLRQEDLTPEERKSLRRTFREGYVELGRVLQDIQAYKFIEGTRVSTESLRSIMERTISAYKTNADEAQKLFHGEAQQILNAPSTQLEKLSQTLQDVDNVVKQLSTTISEYSVPSPLTPQHAVQAAMSVAPPLATYFTIAGYAAGTRQGLAMGMQANNVGLAIQANPWALFTGVTRYANQGNFSTPTDLMDAITAIQVASGFTTGGSKRALVFALQDALSAAQFARALGVSPTTMGQLAGQLIITSGVSAASVPSTLRNIAAYALGSGMSPATFVSGLDALLSQAQTRAVVNPNQAAALISAISNVGKQYGAVGLQGPRAIQFISGLSGAVAQGDIFQNLPANVSIGLMTAILGRTPQSYMDFLTVTQQGLSTYNPRQFARVLGYMSSLYRRGGLYGQASVNYILQQAGLGGLGGVVGQELFGPHGILTGPPAKVNQVLQEIARGGGKDYQQLKKALDQASHGPGGAYVAAERAVQQFSAALISTTAGPLTAFSNLLSHIAAGGGIAGQVGTSLLPLAGTATLGYLAARVGLGALAGRAAGAVAGLARSGIGRILSLISKLGGPASGEGGAVAEDLLASGLSKAAGPLVGAALAVPEVISALHRHGQARGMALGRAVGSFGGGILGGVLAGAALGSVVPGVGTVIGGLAGAVLGGIGGQVLGGWLGSQLYSTGAQPRIFFKGQKDFIRRMLPFAKEAAKKTGLPANFILSQWAEESGWGTSYDARVKLNFAGIGAYDSNPNNAFSYNSLQDFTLHYVSTINQSRYNLARLYAHMAGLSPYYRMVAIGTALHQEGYASDPMYGQTIGSVFRSVLALESTMKVGTNNLNNAPGSTVATAGVLGGIPGNMTQNILQTSPIVNTVLLELASAIVQLVHRNGVMTN